MAGIIVGSVGVSITPDARGFGEKLKAALQPVADAIGRSVGQAIGDRISDAMPAAGVSAGTKFSDTFKAKVDAALAKLPDATVNLNDDRAQAKLEELRMRLSALSASVGIEIDATEALAEMRVIRTELDALGARSPKIDVQVDIARASAELGVLETEVDKLSGDSGGGGFIGLLKRIRGAADGFPALISAGLAVGPALIPVIAVLGAGLASLLGPIVAATAGVAAFAAVAIPAISGTLDAQKKLEAAQLAYKNATTDKQRAAALLKEKQATEGLTGAQTGFLSVLDQVEAAFKKVTAAAQPLVLAAVSAGLRVALPLIAAIAPIVQQVAPAIAAIADSFSVAFSGPGFTKFVNFVADEAPIALGELGNIALWLGETVAHLAEAFAPLGNTVLVNLDHALVHLSESTANLGQSKGFQSFIAYVVAEAPKVGAFFAALATTVGHLVEAFVPVGTIILPILTGVFTAINAIPIPVLTAIAAGITLIGVALLFASANPIILIISAVVALAAGVAELVRIVVQNFSAIEAFVKRYAVLIIAALTPILGPIALLGAAALLLYEHWRTVVTALSGAARTVASSVMGALSPLVGFFTVTLPGAFAAVVGAVESIPGLISAALAAVGNAVVVALRALPGLLLDLARLAWQAFLLSTEDGIAAVIFALVLVPYEMVRALIAIVTAIPGLAVRAWAGFTAATTAAAEAVVAFVAALPGRILAALTSLIGMVAGLATAAWSGFLSVTTFVASATAAFVASVPGRILDALVSLIGLVAGLASSAWSGFLAVTTFVIASTVAFVAGLPGRIVGAIGSLAGSLAAAAASAWAAFAAATYNGMGAAVANIAALPGEILDAIGDLSTLLTNVGASIVDGLWNGFQKEFHKALGWMHGLLSEIPGIHGSPSFLEIAPAVLQPVGALMAKGLGTGFASAIPGVVSGMHAQSLGFGGAPLAPYGSSLAGLSVPALTLAPGSIQGGDSAIERQNALLAQQNRHLAVIAGNTGQTGAQVAGALNGVTAGAQLAARGGRF